MRSASPATTAGPDADPWGDSADVLHGRTVTDPFRWLEASDTESTRGWLARREREFAEHAAAWPAREPLAAEIRALVRADDWSAPRRRAAAVFATHRAADDEHPRLVAITAEGTRVLFDPREADPSGRTTLDAWEPDPAGRLVAVQTSQDGVERGTLRVLDTDTGQPVSPPIEGVRYTHVAWLPSGPVPAFYYVRRDGDRRGVWLHRVGADRPESETLVHACTGRGTVPGVRVEGRRWLLVSESHGTGHREDLWIADLASRPPERPEPRPVHVGIDAESEARIGPDGLLYLRTTAGAPLRRICRMRPEDPDPAHWEEVVAAGDAPLDAFALTGAEILVCRTRLGISELSAHARDDGRLLRRVPLPGEGMVARLETTPDPRLSLSETAPETVCVGFADVATNQRILLYRPGADRLPLWPAPSDAARLRRNPAEGEGTTPVHRRVVSCRSADGTEIPITLLSTRPFDAERPTIVHAYGAYGRPRQFGFSATVLAWLRTGGQYAVAHVRGGGDLGREWHRAGSRRNKRSSVADLVAAVESLVSSGYCSRRQVCLSGGSAGGLLVLAAIAERPDLCAAVIASAPLADMVRFERFGLGRMWTREFGTAADPEDFAALLSYSPYHRVLRRGGGCRYPAVLLTGFHGDTRTGAAHPRKMCAALRWAEARPSCQDAEAPENARPSAGVLLRYEYGVGHGPRAVSRAVDLAADAHAFAAAHTGLAPPPRSAGEGQRCDSEGR